MSRFSSAPMLRLRRVIYAFCFTTLLASVSGSLFAGTYYVRTNGNDRDNGQHPQHAFQSIAKAAEKAKGGDTVYVGAGVYEDTVQVVGAKHSPHPLQFIADVHGRFTGDAGRVVISGASFRVAGSNGVQLTGFNFRGQNAYPIIWQDSYDGAVSHCTFADGVRALLMKNGSLTLDGCHFAGNQGDAIQVDGTAKLLVRGCNISDAQRHGINIRKNAVVVIDGSTISNNSGNGVHVEVTTDTIPVPDIEDENCECSDGTSPVALKQQADELLAAVTPESESYRDAIAKVRHLIQQSLNAAHWSDDWHVRVGAPVFNHSREAVERLVAVYNEEVDFDISDGEVVVDHPFMAEIKVLGAAITSSGYNMPVTTMLRAGDSTYQPWGSFGSPTRGNVNDGNNPRSYESPAVFEEGERIGLSARSWIKQSSSYSGSSDSHWREYMTVTSTSRSANLKVLRDGDPVPNMQGANGQEGAASFIRPYIGNNGRVTLQQNQVIFLFELGTTNLSSSAADFQDLVVLLTMRRMDDGEEPGDDDSPLTEEEAAKILTAINKLMESDRALAKCAINENSCADGDQGDIAEAIEHYQNGIAHRGNDEWVEASDDFRRAWETANQSTANRDVSSAARLADKLRGLPTIDLAEITTPRLVVSGSTVTGNDSGVVIQTKQSFASRASTYSDNEMWGLCLNGPFNLAQCTINANETGGVWLKGTMGLQFQISDLTIANNGQYGLFAESCALDFTSTTMREWGISGSEYSIVGHSSDMAFDGATVPPGSAAAVRCFDGNMKAYGATFAGSGYGLAAERSNVVLVRCKLSENRVGLYAKQNKSLAVQNCTFAGNDVWGATVHVGGSSNILTPVLSNDATNVLGLSDTVDRVTDVVKELPNVLPTTTFTGCTFSGNGGGLSVNDDVTGEVRLLAGTVLRDNKGAGLRFEKCDLTLNDQLGGTNWRVVNNYVGIQSDSSTLKMVGVVVEGSSVFGVRGSNSDLTLTRCTIHGRGGVHADASNLALTLNATKLIATKSRDTLLAQEFVANDDVSILAGWGVANLGSKLTVLNCMANGFRHGLYVSGPSEDDAALLLNNTIVNVSGYGVLVAAGDVSMHNTILVGQGGRYGLAREDGHFKHSHNVIHGFNYPYQGTSAGTEEYMRSPRFVDLSNEDFHLSSGSPCINSGLDVGDFVSSDLDGITRPMYRAFEIGAYEYALPGGSVRILQWAEKKERTE